MRTFSALNAMIADCTTPIDDSIGALVLMLVRKSSNIEVAEKMLGTLMIVARDFNASDTINLKQMLRSAADMAVPKRTILNS